MSKLRWPQSEYLVNEQAKFVLCPIPKVASSSLKQWFISTLPVDVLPAGAHERPHLALADWSFGKYRANLNELRHIAFVRHPARRLLSAYLQKIVDRWDVPQSPGRVIVHKVYTARGTRADFQRGITFREFVTALAQLPIAEFDVHWRPQHLFLPAGFPRRGIDFLGRVETFADDLHRLNEVLGLATRCDFAALQMAYDDERVNGAADLFGDELRERSRFPEWRSFFDDEIVALTWDLYAVDCERFGYATSPVELGQPVSE